MAKLDKKKSGKNIRVALNFDKELLDIQDLRIKKGTVNPRDAERNSIRRITEAIPRHPFWPQFRADVIKERLDKKDLDLS